MLLDPFQRNFLIKTTSGIPPGFRVKITGPKARPASCRAWLLFRHKKLIQKLARSRCAAPDIPPRGDRDEPYRKKIRRSRATKRRIVRRKQMPVAGFETASK
jgi:hypothetical protein